MKPIKLFLFSTLLCLALPVLAAAQPRIKSFVDKTTIRTESIHPDSVYLFNDTVFVVKRTFKNIQPSSVWVNVGYYIYTKNRDSMIVHTGYDEQMPEEIFDLERFRANPDLLPFNSRSDSDAHRKERKAFIEAYTVSLTPSKIHPAYGGPAEFEWVLSVLKSRDKKTKNKKK